MSYLQNLDTNTIKTLTAEHGSAVFINVSNIVANYKSLQKASHPAVAACVLKSNAYGIGAPAVAEVLASAGCEHFFVATLKEALELKPLIGAAQLYVLHGVYKDTERSFVEHNIIPVINSYNALRGWSTYAHDNSLRLPCVIHLDTGMNRLGFSGDEVQQLAKEAPSIMPYLDVKFVMSHLACATQPSNPANEQQLKLFKQYIKNPVFEEIPRSLAASDGIFLGKDYHFDLVRPGYGLYGFNTFPHNEFYPNGEFKPVVSFYTTVLQINHITKGTAIGYDHEWSAPRDSILATVSVGYKDGINIKHTEGEGFYIGGVLAPVVGRVSMDSVMIDVTDHQTRPKPRDLVEIIGPSQDVDAFTKFSNTIDCHALNMLTTRYPKFYYKK